MLKNFLFVAIICLTSIVHTQEIKGRVVDASGHPIIFAAIQTDDNTGVISNEEGYFTVILKSENERLTISCLGFATISISAQDLKNNGYTIVLEEQVNQLDQVYLTDKIPDAYDIIRKANENLGSNYSNENIKYKLFFRETSYNEFSRLNFEITKATGIKKRDLVSANMGLDSLTNTIQDNTIINFKDYLAELLLKNRSNSKLNVIKATQLIDRKKDISVDDIQEKAQRIILKYLDTTKTYKLKTGIIKIEDSLSLTDDDDSKHSEPSFEYLTANLRSESHEHLFESQVYDGTILKKLLDNERYKYEYVNATVYGNELVHVIAFKTRRSKAKFQGKLYIADESFAVLKLDYKYAKGKRGEKLNLKFILGIKYVEDVKNGTIIYSKSNDSIYHPKYIKEEDGSYFYVNRPLKFIENSPEKNKVRFSFLIEGNKRDKSELLIVSQNAMDDSEYDTYSEDKKVSYESLSSYDPTIWAEYNALEPLKEMKEFKSSD
ncbi:MAG: carboxypeptidase-like regulatory domain-containing protein [Bacteroidota bacterium]